MTCQDSFHEVAFNISFWTRNISSARILFWRGVHVRRKYTAYEQARKSSDVHIGNVFRRHFVAKPISALTV